MPSPCNTCRPREGGEPRCRLATLGCRTVEIRGTSFRNVLESIRAGENVAKPLPPLAPGQYDVMVIGEGPGFEEDKRGLPFQGQAGLKLAQLLVRSGLDIDRIFVTNMVRCRPPKNRDPAVKEIIACRDYLTEEIQALQPKVVVLLGNKALRAFNLQGEGGISYIRGKVFYKEYPHWEGGPEFQVLPTLHPAALNRAQNKKLETACQNDYRLAASILRGESAEARAHTEYTLIDTWDKLDWLVGQLGQQPVFAYDTESCSLSFVDSPFLCYSFGWADGVAVVPVHRHAPENRPWKITRAWGGQEKQVHAKLRQVFENPRIAKIAHNLKYDLNVLWCRAGTHLRGRFLDTMLFHHLLDPNPPHGLEQLGKILLGFPDYGEDVRKIVGQGKHTKTYDHIPDEILWPYTATDSLVTWRLYQLFYPELRGEAELWSIYEEETEPLIVALAEAERNGVLLDRKVLDRLREEVSREQGELLAKMRQKTWPDFKPTAQQVFEAGCHLGYREEVTNEDKAMGYQTSKDVIGPLAEDEPFFQWVMDYRRLSDKVLSTYIVPAEEAIESDGRARFTFKIHGTKNGRLSATWLHQIPNVEKDKVKAGRPTLRDVVIAAPGYQLVYGDYSQVELRVGAFVANDEYMLQLFATGEDIHTATAAEILGLPLQGEGEIRTPGGKLVWARAKDNRSVGKTLNFGIVYGSEGQNLLRLQWVDVNGKKYSMTEAILQFGIARWRQRFAGLASYLRDAPDEGRLNGGVLINDFDRRRPFGTRLNDERQGERKRAEREFVNARIQGDAGHITNRTIVAVREHLNDLIQAGQLRPDDVRLINTVHDSITYEVRDHYVEWFCGVFKHIAERPIPQLGNLSFPLEIGVGPSWTRAEMKEDA